MLSFRLLFLLKQFFLHFLKLRLVHIQILLFFFLLLYLSFRLIIYLLLFLVVHGLLHILQNVRLVFRPKLSTISPVSSATIISFIPFSLQNFETASALIKEFSSKVSPVFFYFFIKPNIF